MFIMLVLMIMHNMPNLQSLLCYVLLCSPCYVVFAMFTGYEAQSQNPITSNSDGRSNLTSIHRVVTISGQYLRYHRVAMPSGQYLRYHKIAMTNGRYPRVQKGAIK